LPIKSQRSRGLVYQELFQMLGVTNRINSRIIREGMKSYQCRVLFLSDCNYSLNPLNQTRIDQVGLDRIRCAFKLSCNLVRSNYRRIVAYKTFINKQLQHKYINNKAGTVYSIT